MVTTVAPMLIPFVVRAEPTSNTESRKLTPMVMKIMLKMIRVTKKPIIMLKTANRSSRVGCSPFLRMALMTVRMRSILIPPAMLKVQPPAKPTRIRKILAGIVVLPIVKDSMPVDDAMLTTLNSDSKGFTHAKMLTINPEARSISRYSLISSVRRLRSFRRKRL